MTHGSILAVLLACGGKKPPGSSADGSKPSSEPGWEGSADASSMEKASSLVNSPDEAKVKEGLAQLQSMDQKIPEVVYDEGVAYQKLGDLAKAKDAYTRAVTIDPTFGQAWLNLGAVAERQGDLAQALQYYRTGLEHDPDNADLVVGVIGVLRRQGQADLAIAEAKKALGKNSNNINAYNNLGLVYIDQGKLDLALFIYQKALNSIDGAGQNALLHTNLGKVYLAQGKVGDAKQELERALELDPNQVAARMFLAQYYLENRDWQMASEMLERAQRDRARERVDPAEPRHRVPRARSLRRRQAILRARDGARSGEHGAAPQPRGDGRRLPAAVRHGDRLPREVPEGRAGRTRHSPSSGSPTSRRRRNASSAPRSARRRRPSARRQPRSARRRRRSTQRTRRSGRRRNAGAGTAAPAEGSDAPPDSGSGSGSGSGGQP